MKIENDNGFVRWEGKLPNFNNVNSYRLDTSATGACLGISHGGLYVHVYVDSLPHLLNLWRDLGSMLDELQPGLVNPLPDGDRNEVDAMKVIHEADLLQRGGK